MFIRLNSRERVKIINDVRDSLIQAGIIDASFADEQLYGTFVGYATAPSPCDIVLQLDNGSQYGFHYWEIQRDDADDNSPDSA